jgi:hypothetical protein
MKNHYVYKLVDISNGEFYYGSRSCNCKAIEDVSYMGSYKIWKPVKSNLEKIIIKENFENRQSAIDYESMLIKNEVNNIKNKNYHIPITDKFVTTGTITCYDTVDNKYLNITLDEYYKNKQRYISNAKKHGVGVGNSQYNTIWVNNGIKQLKINKNDDIPNGFIKGRLDYIWVHNPITHKNTRIIQGSEIPNGYIEGRYFSKKTKDKMSKSLKGIPLSDETKEKMSKSKQSKKNKDILSKTGYKLGIGNKGRILSEEHKKNISNSIKKVGILEK